MPWSSHSCNECRYSYFKETFAIDMLTVLKSFLEHDRKHVLRLSRLYLDGETRLEFLVGSTSFVILTFPWN